MSRPQVGYQHFVVGKALDRDHAGRVYEYLEQHGVDANDVRLAGSAAAQVDLAALDPIDAVGHARHKAEAGALIGALAGAAIGAGGGLLATAGNVSRDLLFFLAVVFVFTGLGAWVAASVTAARAMRVDDSRGRTFDCPDDSPWIAVRVRSEREANLTRDLFTFEGVSLVDEDTADNLGVSTFGS